MEINWYGKKYIANCGKPGHYWYHIGLHFYEKADEKKFGYWYLYYDGKFEMFSFYPFKISFWKRPELIDD